MKFLIGGGGTGGHLTPGIALYQEITGRGLSCKYILRNTDLRYSMTERIAENDRFLIEIQGISRKLSFKTIVYLWKMLKVFFRVHKYIRTENPDVIVITGGYVSNPVALSALLLKKPLYIAEQNSVAGITNRFYSRWARGVFTSFPVTKKLRTNKSYFFGNPSIFQEKPEKKAALQYFNSPQGRNFIGVTGGSQGAAVINDSVYQCLPNLKRNRIGVIWSVGAVDYQRMESEGKIRDIKANYPNVVALKFIDRMDHFFSAVDMVISRAGATSIAEIIHYQVPPVLIPIKNSPDDHQKLNAMHISDHQAGLLIEEHELNPTQMIENIEYLLNNQSEYRSNLNKLRKDQPSRMMIDFILNDKI